MLQYVDDVMLLKEINVNGKIEFDATDEYAEPELRDINDKHIIKWLIDNKNIWAKEVVQCLRRA